MITKYTAKLHYSFFHCKHDLTYPRQYIHRHIITNLLAWYSRIYRPQLSAISGGRATLCVNKQASPDTKLRFMAAVSDVSATRQKIAVGARYHSALRASVSTRKSCS